MIQLILLAVSFVMAVCSLVAFAGKMKLTADVPLSGSAAVCTGLGLLAGAVGAAYVALFILPAM